MRALLPPRTGARVTPRRSRSLVERLRRGDDRAWARWYDDLAPALTGYARSKGATDPDDLVGDVFAAAAERIATFEGSEAQLRSWAFTIAHHRIADDLRRRRRRSTHVVAPASLEPLAPHAEPEPVEARLDAAGALALLDELTEDQREVIVLRVVAELSLAETAEVTGRPVGAVKALQHRGLARLHRRVHAEEDAVRTVDRHSGTRRPHPAAVSGDDGGGHA